MKKRVSWQQRLRTLPHNAKDTFDNCFQTHQNGGLMEISSGIHWLEARASNMFLCVETDGLTLIDAGIPRKQKQLFAEVARLGYKPQDLKRILVTHADLDHVGSLAAIQAESGARIYAGQQTADFLVKGKSPQHLPRLAQLITDTFFKYKAISETVITVFSAGESLPFLGGIQVIASPGHTADHFSFYCPQAGVLFAGDALNTRNGRINPSPKRMTADPAAANHSAIRLLQLSPAVIACGHGAPLADHSSKDLMTAFNQFRNE